MISFRVKFDAAKRGFFDRKAVVDAVGAATARNAIRFGGQVRTVARRSMRYRDGVSQPGQPPHAHLGLIRDRVFFSFDTRAKSLVVGPTLINRPSSTTYNVPEKLEKGGPISVREVQLSGGLWVQEDDRRNYQNRARPVRMRAATIAARPFMKPAYDFSKKELPDIWRNSVKPA